MNPETQILIVNATPEILQAQTRLLQNAGYRVLEAYSGKDGLRIIRETKPDLVLVDEKLPDLPGDKICRDIKADPELVDIFVLLVLGERKISKKPEVDREDGADGYITYPISDQELLAQVRLFLRLQQTQRSLQQSNLKAERILNLTPDLICTAGMDGYFKYINPAWETVLGYTEEELLSNPFLTFIHPEDHAKNDREVAHLADEQQTLNFENRYLHKDGYTRHISWTATPDLEEKVMYCIGRDITTHKQSEKAFYQAQQRLIDSQEIAQIGWWEYDIQADQMEWSEAVYNCLV